MDEHQDQQPARERTGSRAWGRTVGLIGGGLMAGGILAHLVSWNRPRNISQFFFSENS